MNKLHWDDYIEERPGVLQGKPVFKGTRISVELVLQALGAGTTVEELLREFPSLKTEHIRSAMLYAAELVHD